MKYGIAMALALPLISAGCYWGRAYPHPHPLSKEDVIRLAEEGVSDDVIISQISATHAKYFLSVDDILTLRKRKVSERVIDHMIRTARHPGDPPY